MTKGRVEAFSDGVMAVLITIMVLELKVPHGQDLAALAPLLPTFLGYLLSFIYLGIYWNNHHHMFQAVKHIDGSVLWANLHLLFWLSLVPAATTWVGENHTASGPTAFYGFLLLMAGLAYWILQCRLMRLDGNREVLHRALGADRKGRFTPLVYVAGIALSFVRPWVGQVCYVAVAFVWLLPDPRIERELIRRHEQGEAPEPSQDHPGRTRQ